MEVNAWEVKEGKLESVRVFDRDLGISSLVRLRAPVEITQIGEIKTALERFFDIAGEVVPARKVREKIEKPKRLRRIKKGFKLTQKLEEFERGLRDRFRTQEFTTKDIVQHQIEKGETESLALRNKILYNMRRLQRLKLVRRIKKGIYRIPS